MSKSDVFEKAEITGLVSDDSEAAPRKLPDPISENKKTNLAKDKWNICLLLVLYFLQGVPLGLCGSISTILTFRGVPYSALGTISLVYWPFSLKLLWAPVVDSLYIKRFGRRKSWLIPTQTLIAIFMLAFADYVHKALQSASTKADIINLTLIFFTLSFLVSVQDIIVDGWALTMLAKENVSVQSTCNAIGQTLGSFIASSVFIIFESPKFSNKYLRKPFGYAEQETGLVTIRSFMYFFGAVYFIVTVVVLIFKRETVYFTEDELREQKAIQLASEDVAEDNVQVPSSKTPSLLATYKLIFKIMLIKPVQKLAFILLTMNVGTIVDAVYHLKLIEYGVSKEILSLFSIPLVPMSLILSAYLTKHLTGPKPFSLNIPAITWRIIVCIVFAATIYFTPYFMAKGMPIYYLLFLFCLLAAKSFGFQVTFVARMAFFARVSDPLIGGTYITLLNTVSNIGILFPDTIGLYLVGFFGAKNCLQNPNLNITISADVDGKTCSSIVFEKMCSQNGGTCRTTFESVFILTGIFAVLGVVWLYFFSKVIRQLDAEPLEDWKISHFFKINRKTLRV